MLAQLKNQLTFHIIHGMSQIEEDFRLKNLLAQLESIASKNKVIDSIYQDLSLVLQAENKNKTTALLQCLAKINGILYVQGKSDIPLENEFEETIVFDDVRRENFTWKYSEIASLILALTKKEKNRLQTIEWYLANKPLIFADFRVIQALVCGLSDGSGDIRQYCKYILLELGTKKRNVAPSPELVYRYVTKENPLPIVEPTIIVSELKKDFDMNGKSDMIERLELISKLGKEQENEWYRTLLESKKKEIRSMAILNLKYSQDNIPLLLQLLENKKEKNTTEIYRALSELQYDNQEFWKSIIEKKIEYIEYLEGYKSEKYLDLYIECCKLYIEMCVKKQREISYTFLEINVTETSDKLIEFYLWVLDYLKDSKEKNNFLSSLDMLFVQKICFNETPKMYKFIEQLSEDDKREMLGSCFVCDSIHLSTDKLIEKWKKYSLLLSKSSTLYFIKIQLYHLQKHFRDIMKWESIYCHICYCILRIIVECDLYQSLPAKDLFFSQVIKDCNIQNEDPFRMQLGKYCYYLFLEELMGVYSQDMLALAIKTIVFNWTEILKQLDYDFKDIVLDVSVQRPNMKDVQYCNMIEQLFVILCDTYSQEVVEVLKKKVLSLYDKIEFETEKSYELKDKLEMQ